MHLFQQYSHCLTRKEPMGLLWSMTQSLRLCIINAYPLPSWELVQHWDGVQLGKPGWLGWDSPCYPLLHLYLCRKQQQTYIIICLTRVHLLMFCMLGVNTRTNQYFTHFRYSILVALPVPFTRLCLHIVATSQPGFNFTHTFSHVCRSLRDHTSYKIYLFIGLGKMGKALKLYCDVPGSPCLSKDESNVWSVLLKNFVGNYY